MAVAIYFDGRNAYQSNFGGTRETAARSFFDEMVKRKAIWGKLFLTQCGEHIASYNDGEKLRVKAINSAASR